MVVVSKFKEQVINFSLVVYKILEKCVMQKSVQLIQLVKLEHCINSKEGIGKVIFHLVKCLAIIIVKV